MGDPLVLVSLCMVVAIAGCIQGLIGFGAGLVMVSTLPWFMDISFVVPFAAIFSYCTVLALAWRHRKEVRFRYALPLIVGLFPGIPLGMAFLQGVDPLWATGALGVVLVTYTLWSLRSESSQVTRISPKWGPVFGVTGGILGGAFNSSGPPVVLYATLQDWNKGETVGTLQAFFLCQGALTISGFVYKGLVNAETITWNIYLLPALLVGLWLGDKVHHRIDEGSFRRIVMVGLMLMGVAFLLRLALSFF